MSANHYMINMQKLLHMAAILHNRGFENLHIIPSLSPSGLSWRCSFINAFNEEMIASIWLQQQIDINNESVLDAIELANRFERENFNFLRSCIGENKEYIGWYSRMLDTLEEEELPYAFSDYFSVCDYWETSSNRRIPTLPNEIRFLDIFMNGKKVPVNHEIKFDTNIYSVPETMPINSYDYASAINALNFANAWVSKNIVLFINTDQYQAMLKGYQLHWDMRFGLLYDQKNDFFYTYRSGYIIGKYKVEKDEDRYLFLESFENPYKPDCMVIYDCVMEACKQNDVSYNSQYFADFAGEALEENRSCAEGIIPDLGPQSTSDTPFTAKARKLQSVWRVQNGLEIGIGPEKNSVDRNGQPTYYGNMIKDGESNGRNFFYPETFAYAQWRVHTKLKDETINDYRLFNNLMSSMPMAFNLFHPLMMLHAQNPVAVDKMMQNAFPDLPIYKIKEIGLEYIPTPIDQYTNDKSAMDAFISFWDKDGGEHIIAIETKYTDSLGTNSASVEGVVEKQIQMLKDMNLLAEEGMQKLESKKIRFSQIYRNFLLIEKYREVKRLTNSYSIILAPKDNLSTKNEIKFLIEHLLNEKKLTDYKLEDFVSALKLNCTIENLDWLEWFEDRYLNFAKLEKL